MGIKLWGLLIKWISKKLDHKSDVLARRCQVVWILVHVRLLEHLVELDVLLGVKLYTGHHSEQSVVDL